MAIVSGIIIPSGCPGTGRRLVSVHGLLISSLFSKVSDLLIQPMGCSILVKHLEWICFSGNLNYFKMSLEMNWNKAVALVDL